MARDVAKQRAIRAPIAIVGISCEFPGASGPEAYWDLLKCGRDAVGQTPPDRWNAPALFDPDPAAAGCVVTRQGGFLSSLADFDPESFGITPFEAASMDPRQRLALKTAWWCFEDAGMPLRSLAGREVGVFVGASNSEFGGFDDLADITAGAGTGIANAIIANRISYAFDLTGPSMVIDTACSSSLVAVHTACLSLAAGECELALAGGVNALLRPDQTVCFSRAGMLAPDGRCKSFDASADGYGRGEGAGFIILKRLEDAIADGDHVTAVIRGSAINQDGASNGITAPNGLSQERVIRAALDHAGLDPGQVQFVEAHGTGTPLGDPIEAQALGRTLGQVEGRYAPLQVGSVKTNIGHAEAAAGIAGLIKVALAIRHQQLPPSLHYREPNARIDFDKLNIQVTDRLADWPDSQVRIAGVSSFGFGGANAHVILAQRTAQAESPGDSQDANSGAHLLTLSATTDNALRTFARLTAQQLICGAPLPEIARQSQHARDSQPHRLAIAGCDSPAVADALMTFAGGKPSADICCGRASRRAPRIAFLFTGQGGQRPGMGRGLIAHSRIFRDTLEEAQAILGMPVIEILRNADPVISRTDIAQPVILAVQTGLVRMYEDWGVKPTVVCGHSLGEYTAASVAGAIAFDDALRLVAERGRLMQALPERGAMAAAFGEADSITPHLCEGVVIAAHNAPGVLSIAGPQEALAASCRALARAGVDTRPLDVSVGFHSCVLDPMLAGLGEAAGSVTWRPLQIPLISNETGQMIAAGTTLDAEHWVRHARAPVRFGDSVQTLAEAGTGFALEMGAAPVLSRLVAMHAQGNNGGIKSAAVLQPDQADAAAALNALGALHVSGGRIDWTRVSSRHSGARLLPLYPFDEKPFPLHMPKSGSANTRTGDVVPGARQAPNQSVSSEQPVSLSQASQQQTDSHQPVARQLQCILAALMATTPERIDVAAPFLEMGADSLMLMSAIREIETRFHTKLSVRLLFEELSTIEALAHYLESQNDSANVDQAANFAGRDDPVQMAPAKPQRRAYAPAPVYATRQQAHLDGLIKAFTKKTAASKAYAARNRPHMADSRSSAGFRFTTKEMLYPIVGESARGARMRDLDGNEYVDIAMGFGVHLFGHDPDFIRAAMRDSMARGLRLGPQSDLAGDVARRIARLAGQDRVTFSNSGTEAVMTAMRLARTVTGRDRIAIFRGSYHGHFDGVLGDAPPAADTDGQAGRNTANALPWASPLAPGVTSGAVSDLIVLDYGEASALDILRRHAGELAAILVEPVQSRRPGLQPAEFLAELRQITEASGTLLVFDEMITGLRLAPGGAQELFNVRADVVTYGKIIGGGLPIGIVAGRADVMAAIDGGVWQYGDNSYPGAETTFFAGTFNKHPLTMAAANAVLDEIERQGPALQQRLGERTRDLAARLDDGFTRAAAPMVIERCGSLFRFGMRNNLDPFFYHLLLRGIYVWEGRTCFLSDAHTTVDVDTIVDAVSDSVSAMAADGFFDDAPVRPVVSGQMASPDASPIVVVPLTAAQRQLAVLAAMDSAGSSAYVVPVALELTGTLDIDRLAKALTRAAARHDGPMTGIDLEKNCQTIASARAIDLPVETIDANQINERITAAVSQPFDLSQPPLLRARLLQISARRSILLLTGHHAVLDGIAMQILIEETARIYSGEDLALPEARMRDFSAWLQAQEATPQWRGHAEYWRGELDGFSNSIDLSVARPRPAARRYAGGRASRNIDAVIIDALQHKAGRSGATLTMALLAIFSALLERCGGHRDLVIGVPYAGRDMPGGERLVGYCTHMLPVRMQFAAATSLDELLAAARGKLLDAYSHADLPLATIIEQLAPRRDPSRPLLVPFSLNIDRINAPPQFKGLEVSTRAVEIRQAKFDLGLNLMLWDGGARLELDYDADLFEPAIATSLLEDFCAIAALMVEQPQTTLPQISLATQPVLPGWRETPAPAFRPLPRRIHDLAIAAPDAPAVEVCGQAAMSRLTLAARAAAAADMISAATDKGGPAALLLPRGEAIVIAMLAAWRSGRAYVPIDPDTPLPRIRQMLELSGASCVLTNDPATFSAVADIYPVLNVAHATPSPPHMPTTPVDPQAGDIAYILFTSGSTGLPKPVAVPHRALSNYLDGLIGQLGLATGLRYAIVSTFAADLGLTSVLPALAHGGTLVIASETLTRTPDEFAAAMAANPVDVLKIVPGHLQGLLAAGEPQRVLPRKFLLLGGEPARPQLLDNLRQMDTVCRIYNHYGPTEATIGVMTGLWDRQASPQAIAFDAPLAGVRLLVLDAHGQAAAHGEAGELHVGGPALASGYVGQPDATAEKFISHRLAGPDGKLYCTGDLARLRPDGCIEIIGRIDDQVKIRGYRVEPSEVTAVLSCHPGIAAAAVVPAQHPVSGSCLVAYVVGRQTGAPDSDAVRAFAAARLPAHMTPAAVVAMQSLPLNANGKLDRSALPQPQWSRASAEIISPADEAAMPAAAAQLLTIWRQLFAREEIGAGDNFFELGGDSIMAMQMQARLHRIGYRISANAIYRHPTIAGLAPHLAAAAASTAEQGMLTGPLPLLPSQLRFIDLFGGAAPHFNLSVILEVEDWVTCSMVASAFEHLVSHHDALRTCVDQNGAAELCANVHIARAVIAPGIDPTAAFAALQAALDPASGRLAGFAFASGAPPLLLVAFHHLAVDGVSMQLLLEDLRTCLQALRNGGTPALGSKTASIRQVADALRERARTPALLEEEDFWELTGSLPPVELPRRDLANGSERYSDQICLTAELPADTTAAFLRDPAAAGFEADDVLIAALTLALGAWSGEPLVFLDLEGHGRDFAGLDLDAARTVGWFTTRYPAWFDLEGTPLEETLTAIREQRQAIPARGTGYGLLRYLGDAETRKNLAGGNSPQISFNYLGQISATQTGVFIPLSWEPDRPERGGERNPRMIRTHALAIECYVRNGCLVTDWQYNPQRHDPQAIAKVADAFHDRIAALLATIPAPSDSSPAGLPVASISHVERL